MRCLIIGWLSATARRQDSRNAGDNKRDWRAKQMVAAGNQVRVVVRQWSTP